MTSKINYKTRQKEAMLEFFRSAGGKHFTAADVYNYFVSCGISIGNSTIYRYINQLVSEGTVRKYVIDEKSSVCYEYVGTEVEKTSCYHLKCEECGTLIHLECDEITMFESHITEHHGFRIDSARTVFYGTCAGCLAKKGGCP